MDWALVGMIIAVGSFLAVLVALLLTVFYDLAHKDDRYGPRPEK